jgi:hypothetical protein
MIESIASGNSKAVENYSATDVLPDFFEDQAKNLIELIKAYYKHLNTELNASHEISNLVSSHDVDRASDKYLDAIQRIIAKNIPQSETLDRKRLFKIIANYYTNRGSEESIYTFFKIFYNEVVTLIYPKDFVFHTSTEQGVISDKFRLRDSYRWQEFSYQISSNRDTAEWKDEFKKFVHPAGLKFFTALTVGAVEGDISLDTMWNDGCNQLTKYLNQENIPEDPCEFWESIDWEKAVGKHSPFYQPCIDYRVVYMFSVLYDSNLHYIDYLRNTFNLKCSKQVLKAIYASYSLSLLITDEPYGQVKRWDDIYRGIGKYFEEGAFGDGYLDYTIDGTELEFDSGRTVENNNTKFAGWSYASSIDDFSRSYTNEIDQSEIPLTDLNEWIDYIEDIIPDTNKLDTIIGDGYNTLFKIQHKFNSSNILVFVKDNFTGELMVNVFHRLEGLNDVRIEFNDAPAFEQYSVFLFNVNEDESTGYNDIIFAADTTTEIIDGTTYWNVDIEHSLGNKRILFSVVDKLTNEFVIVNGYAIDDNTLRLTFNEEIDPSEPLAGYIVSVYYKPEIGLDYEEIIGDGVSNEITINHNLNSKNIVFSLRDIATNDYIQLLTSKVVDNDSLTLFFNDIPTLDQYEIYIKDASDNTQYPNLYRDNIGDGSTDAILVNHGLNSINLILFVKNNISGELLVDTLWEVYDNNTMIINFLGDDTPTLNEYSITIFRVINNNIPYNGFAQNYNNDDALLVDDSTEKYVKVGDIDNPPNIADVNAYGSVSYEFNIAKYELRESELALYNADPANSAMQITPVALLGDDKPAQITWNNAARYVNWLNTRKGYQPAYKFSGGGVNSNIELWAPSQAWQLGGENLFRHKDTRYWLTSADEWYKAAFYDPNKDGVGGYWDYATGTNILPIPVASGTGQTEIVYNNIGTEPANVNEAGGLSPYGAMALTGNVRDWLETPFNNGGVADPRFAFGGNYLTDSSTIKSEPFVRSWFLPQNNAITRGFRISTLENDLTKAELFGQRTLDVVHNLNSVNIVYSIIDITDGLHVEVPTEIIDANTLRFSFNGPLDQYRICVYYNPSVLEFTTDLGDGINNEFIVTHDLDTDFVVLSLRENATNEFIQTFVRVENKNELKVVFDDIPTLNEYKLYIKDVSYEQPGFIEYGSNLRDYDQESDFSLTDDYTNSLVYYEPGPTSELICWYPTQSNTAS